MTSKLAAWPMPRIGLGTGWWTARNAIPQEQVIELTRFVLSRPSPFFDTAPLYGSGVSETWLGAPLQEIARASYLLASKAGYAIDSGSQARTDLSRDGILRSVENSLKRLGVGYLDIAHVHDPDGFLKEALDIALPTLCELRDQGVIRAVGAGMNQWPMLAEFARHADVDCFLLAGRYTLLEQKSLPLLDLCLEKGIALFLGGVYNTGILATGAVPEAKYNYVPAPPPIMERVKRLEAICARHDVSLQAAALQFPLAHPAVCTLIIGANSVSEFTSALTAVEAPIAPGFWDELRGEGLIEAEALVPKNVRRTSASRVRRT